MIHENVYNAVLGSVDDTIELKRIKTEQNLAGFVAVNAVGDEYHNCAQWYN